MFYKRTLRSLGKILKGKRYYLRYSQDYVANEAHIARKHISDLENGKTNPSLFLLLKLCSVYDAKLWIVLKEARM